MTPEQRSLPGLPWIFSIYHTVIFILFAFWSTHHFHPPLLILFVFLELPAVPAVILFGRMYPQLSDPTGAIGIYLTLLGTWIIYGVLLERWKTDRRIAAQFTVAGILILGWAMLGGTLLTWLERTHEVGPKVPLIRVKTPS